MLNFTKNTKLILATVIALIIISIATYFIIKKTREGFAITLPTNNYVRGRYFRIEKDTAAVIADLKLSEVVNANTFTSNKDIAKSLDIGGVLIYNNNGTLININPMGGRVLDNNENLINTNPTGGQLSYDNTLSNEYSDTNPNPNVRADTVNNCLKIVQYNIKRTLADATRTMPQTDGTLTLYNYLNYFNGNITMVSLDFPNIYWEYDFGSDVNIAGFEILPRSDHSAICSNFLKVKVFADADTGKTTPLNISDTFDIFPGITEYDYVIPDTFFDTPKENVSYFYIKPLVQPQQPSTQSTMPTTQSTMPTTESTMPTTESTMPTTQSTMHTTQSIMPTTQSTMPTTQSTMPTTQSTMPTTQSTMPTTQSTMPTTQSTMPTSNVPQITTKQLVNVLNNGYNLNTLTSSGASMNSSYKTPSTNIVQTDFSGTSNIYSPYLYYNKGINEKFSGSIHDTGQYNYKIYK